MSNITIEYDYLQFQEKDSYKVPLITALEKNIVKASVVAKLIQFIKDEDLDELEVRELLKIFKV